MSFKAASATIRSQATTTTDLLNGGAGNDTINGGARTPTS